MPTVGPKEIVSTGWEEPSPESIRRRMEIDDGTAAWGDPGKRSAMVVQTAAHAVPTLKPEPSLQASTTVDPSTCGTGPANLRRTPWAPPHKVSLTLHIARAILLSPCSRLPRTKAPPQVRLKTIGESLLR